VVGRRQDLTLDPVAGIIALLILAAYAALRLTGRRKSRRQQIAEMEDADFPEGVDPVADEGPQKNA